MRKGNAAAATAPAEVVRKFRRVIPEFGSFIVLSRILVGWILARRNLSPAYSSGRYRRQYFALEWSLCLRRRDEAETIPCIQQ
jgi:hypothetical protein